MQQHTFIFNVNVDFRRSKRKTVSIKVSIDVWTHPPLVLYSKNIEGENALIFQNVSNFIGWTLSLILVLTQVPNCLIGSDFSGSTVHPWSENIPHYFKIHGKSNFTHSLLDSSSPKKIKEDCVTHQGKKTGHKRKNLLENKDQNTPI